MKKILTITATAGCLLWSMAVLADQTTCSKSEVYEGRVYLKNGLIYVGQLQNQFCTTEYICSDGDGSSSTCYTYSEYVQVNGEKYTVKPTEIKKIELANGRVYELIDGKLSTKIITHNKFDVYLPTIHLDIATDPVHEVIVKQNEGSLTSINSPVEMKRFINRLVKQGVFAPLPDIDKKLSLANLVALLKIRTITSLADNFIALRNDQIVAAVILKNDGREIEYRTNDKATHTILVSQIWGYVTNSILWVWSEETPSEARNVDGSLQIGSGFSNDNRTTIGFETYFRTLLLPKNLRLMGHISVNTAYPQNLNISNLIWYPLCVGLRYDVPLNQNTALFSQAMGGISLGHDGFTDGSRDSEGELIRVSKNSWGTQFSVGLGIKYKHAGLQVRRLLMDLPSSEVKMPNGNIMPYVRNIQTFQVLLGFEF
jgi:hypothetical protein